MTTFKILLLSGGAISSWHYAEFIGLYHTPNLGHGWLAVWIALGICYMATGTLRHAH